MMLIKMTLLPVSCCFSTQDDADASDGDDDDDDDDDADDAEK